MNNKLKLLVLLFIIASISVQSQVKTKSVTEGSHKTWTFDYSQQGWGVREHNMSMTASHVLSSSSINSGHIEMTTPAELTQGWMFGPADAINTDLYKYCNRIHFPNKSGEGYNIKQAIYRLDWIAVSDLANSVEPVQKYNISKRTCYPGESFKDKTSITLQKV